VGTKYEFTILKYCGPLPAISTVIFRFKIHQRPPVR
jgi:hypothetical protein